MMHCTILIDGYNIIFTCGLYGKHATSESLAQARRQLIIEMGQRFEGRAEQVTVVFDAHRSPMPGQKRQYTEGGVNVFYSVDYANADELIDELIGAHPDPRRLTVVSSDHWIQNSARRRRAKFIDSDQWYYEVVPETDSQHPTPKASDKPPLREDNLLNEDERQKLAQWAEQLELDSPKDLTIAPELDSNPPKVEDDSQPFPQDYLDELERQLRSPPDKHFD